MGKEQAKDIFVRTSVEKNKNKNRFLSIVGELNQYIKEILVILFILNKPIDTHQDAEIRLFFQAQI